MVIVLLDVIDEKKPTLSNSRFHYPLSGALVEIPVSTIIQKMSIDKIRFMGDFNSVFLTSILSVADLNFKIKVYNNDEYLNFDGYYQGSNGARIYFGCNTIKAKATNSRDTWVEFNPNKFPKDEIIYLQHYLFQFMNNVHITRLDLAFDLTVDLSDTHTFKHTRQKSTKIYGLDNAIETIYFGSPTSSKQIRIYNKKRQLEQVERVEIDDNVLWRVEIELAGKEIYKILNALNGIEIYIPKYEMLENVQETAMLHYLMSNENNWQKVNPKTRTKYRKLVKETQDFYITDHLRFYLNTYYMNILDQANEYIDLFNTGKKITLRPVMSKS